MDKAKQRLTAVILSEEQILSLDELCQGSSLPPERVVSMIEYGIIEPMTQDTDPTGWQFHAACVTRLQRVIRLQRDLELNLAGAALALELMDEINKLRRLVSVLRRD